MLQIIKTYAGLGIIDFQSQGFVRIILNETNTITNSTSLVISQEELVISKTILEFEPINDKKNEIYIQLYDWSDLLLVIESNNNSWRNHASLSISKDEVKNLIDLLKKPSKPGDGEVIPDCETDWFLCIYDESPITRISIKNEWSTTEATIWLPKEKIEILIKQLWEWLDNDSL